MQQALIELLPGLRRYAYSLTGSFDDADDLVQAAVEKVLTKPPPADVSLSAWIFRICRNQWIDGYRAQKTREQHMYNEAHIQDTIDNTMETNVALHEVDRAMDTLPAEQRELIGLVAIEGKSYKEVSEALNIPMGTVMSRIARARAALQSQLNTPHKRPGS